MRFKSILVFSILLSSYAPTLHAQEAQRELSPGLNYTTIYNKPRPAAADEPTAPDVPQAQMPAKPLAPKVSMTAPQALEEDTQARIWNKYKALATGKAGQEQAAEQQEAAAQEAQPAPAENQGVKTKTFKPQLMHASETTKQAPAPAAPASGITAILQEWKTSKTQQSEMRSKSFKVPTLPDGYRPKSESATEAVTKAASETAPSAP